MRKTAKSTRRDGRVRRGAAKASVALAIAGASVLGATAGASADPNASLLGYRHTTYGKGVQCVQHNINYVIAHHNLSGPSAPPYTHLDEDSQWGPKTDADVRWYQKWRGGLEVDGVVGNATGTDLLNDGDPDVNGDPWGGPRECYWAMPGTMDFG
ncbi:putative peptidoglycan binding protein [Streptomyces sp. BK340]|nr:putative peptidoglycan binding protein [Streptomyces sp. BK340]